MSNDGLDEHRLRRLMEVGRSLVAELNPETVLNRVLEVARDLTGARYAALGILDTKREALERFITLGIDQETRKKIGDLPRGRGVLGLLIEDPRPLRLRDVAHHPSSYGFPPGHPSMTSFLGVPLTIRGEAWGNLYLTDKTDGDFTEADEEGAVILAEWAAIAIDNARLYHRLESQRDELERAVHGLEASTEVARVVGGETDLDRVLELIVKRGRALVRARALVVLLVEGGDLVVASSAGDLPVDLRGARVPVKGSVGGEVLRSRRPERLGEVSKRLRFTLGALGVEADTGLFVPLVFRGRAIGVLEAFDRLGGAEEFGGDDERLMQSFAASAAIAVATAMSVAEGRGRDTVEASERERGRWARELHDGTLQDLAGLRVLVSAARRSEDAENTDRLLAQALDRMDEAIAEMRRLIADLRPAALDELGIGAALAALVDRVTADAPIEVDLDVDLAYDNGYASTRLTPSVENTVYRVIQEGLTNVVRHSGAGRAVVTVIEQDETIELTVRDDGGGFDPAAPSAGFGLAGMRERVTSAGGSVQIETGSGTGTTISAMVPARHRDDGAGQESDGHQEDSHQRFSGRSVKG